MVMMNSGVTEGRSISLWDGLKSYQTAFIKRFPIGAAAAPAGGGNGGKESGKSRKVWRIGCKQCRSGDEPISSDPLELARGEGQTLYPIPRNQIARGNSRSGPKFGADKLPVSVRRD